MPPNHGANAGLSFTISDQDLIEVLSFANTLKTETGIKVIVSSVNHKISVYDPQMKNTPGMAARVFSAIAASDPQCGSSSLPCQRCSGSRQVPGSCGFSAPNVRRMAGTSESASMSAQFRKSYFASSSGLRSASASGMKMHQALSSK